MEKQQIKDTLTTNERLQMSFEQWLERIEGPNSDIVQRVMATPDIHELIDAAPGSRGAHQAFEGGYREHMRQTMMIASHLYQLVTDSQLLDQLPPEEQFSESDALLIMFLHDIEKPFLFGFDESGAIAIRQPMTKPERTQFRTDFIEQFGFELTDNHWNALQFVEGVRDVDYVPGNRADRPLAALCHAADNLSARGFYDYRPTL